LFCNDVRLAIRAPPSSNPDPFLNISLKQKIFSHVLQWRPCLKHLTRLSPDDFGYEANRSKILSAVRDDTVRLALAAAAPNATLSTLLGLAWKSLAEEIRLKYEKRSEDLMAQFKRDHVNWRQLLRSPMIAVPGARKRKRNESSSVPTFVASPKVFKTMLPQTPHQQHPVKAEDESSSSSTADAASDEDDDDGEYKEPSASRPSKRQRSSETSSSTASCSGKAVSLAVMEPAAIAVSAATRMSIRESDWAHLYKSLIGSSQAIDQLTSGSA
jgi:hypothetical protein